MKYQKLEIYWHDAFSYTGYQNFPFLIEELEKGNLQITIGYLLDENKNWIAVAQTLEKNGASSTWFIPKKWIIKRKKL